MGVFGDSAQSTGGCSTVMMSWTVLLMVAYRLNCYASSVLVDAVTATFSTVGAHAPSDHRHCTLHTNCRHFQCSPCLLDAPSPAHFHAHSCIAGIPSEVWRYYLLANRPEQSDSVFTWSDFAEKNNNELLKNLGNFVNRALNFAFASFDARIPAMKAPLDERDTKLISDVNALLVEYNTVMGEVKLKAGLKLVMEMSTTANQYMQDTKPWELKVNAPDRCATVINVACSLVRLVAACMEPFMPGFTDKVR